MPIFTVPVKVVVPATGEVEAGSLAEAFAKVREAIREEDFYNLAGEVEFFANWEEISGLSGADMDSPGKGTPPSHP